VLAKRPERKSKNGLAKWCEVEEHYGDAAHLVKNGGNSQTAHAG